MSVTINDIAKAADVSPSTVSRVVNDSPLISYKTKEKIRKIMKDMNYIPNCIGKQLATQCSNNIGFIINTEDSSLLMDQFFYNIIIGAHNVILAKNYDITICNIKYLTNNDNFLNRFVYSKKVDGLIIHSSVLDNYIISELNTINFPYVVIGHPMQTKNTSWVDIDNISAGEIAARHLLYEGYKKIAYIGGTKNEPISKYRLTGIVNIFKEENLKYNLDYIYETKGTEKDGYTVMKKLLSMPIPPDCVIAVNNNSAFGALNALKEKNIDIPKDFGIVTFDNYPLAPYTTPPLTCINIDTLELGKAAGEILMKKIEHPQSQNKTSYIIPKLLIRKSSTRK